MNNFVNEKNVKIISYTLSLLFMFLHVSLLIIFSLHNITPLWILNLFSASFYVLMVFFVYKKWYFTFTIVSFIEICINMGVTIYFIGWGNGFQIVLIGICILLAYAEYIGRTLHYRTIRAIYLMSLPFAVYVTFYVIGLFHEAPYSLPQYVVIFFEIGWAIIVFVIMSLILHNFVVISTRTQEVLTDEVKHDALTSLPNRLYIRDYFTYVEMQKEQEGFWVAIMDLDDFKVINDTYGHNCGDYVLVTVSKILQDVPKGIKICRWGGEEFLLLGKDSIGEQLGVLEEIRKKVETYPFEFEGNSFHLTCTIGCTHKRKEETIHTWIGRADERLYKGKQHGKNTIIFS